MVLSTNNGGEAVKTTVDGDGDGGGGGGVVKWESLFSKIVLRVLLVEADDSTRQIIAALLRKCSYKVAAVSDGLKAWELLKGKPHSIDLILTEADLPSISGFALLTLIMEHDVCKNIPVIMMSTEDSISNVYKCMLRGAADYLVKPIRRNELRNLWQHVWRRRSSSNGGSSPQDESVGQQKVEATAENNAASDHSSGSMRCVLRNKDSFEKGSDAQSSCTKPDMETESETVEFMQDLSQAAWKKSPQNDANVQNREAYANFGEGFAMGVCTEVSRATNQPKIQRKVTCVSNEASDVSSPKRAINFMGASNNYIALNNGTDMFVSSPSLDLSLRRSHNVVENEVTEERCTLRPSDSSAFTRYTHRSMVPVQVQQTLVSNDFDQPKESGSNSEKNYSHNVTSYKSNAPDPLFNTQNVASFVADQQRAVPVSVKGIMFNNLCTNYGSVVPIYCTQSGPSPTATPNSASRPEATFQKNVFYQNFENSEQLYHQFGQKTNNSTYKPKQDHVMDSVDDRGHVSPTTDQSTSSGFCNGAVMSQFNGMGYGSGCGSNGNADQLGVINTGAESKNKEGYFTPNGSSHRLSLREAALNKFRLKRKDRCYEKKVRYESRKKLAEQRPRVKGQFVRQVHTLVENENNGGSSFDS
ncbi:hypothetical protein ACFE04_010475 [Oxalis oulophora]